MAGVIVGLTIRLLGAPEAQCAGEPLALRQQKTRALLYYLAATEYPHTRDHLAALLWSETTETNARHSLRSTLYYLRQALHHAGMGAALVSSNEQVSLDIDPEACDVTHFRRLLRGDSEQALEQAVALYRGPLLQGFTVSDAPLFEEWARREADELSQDYLALLHRLATLAERREAWSEAIAYLQRLARLDPLSEQVQQHLIRLYLRTGDVGQALRQYSQFEAVLRRELGLDPSPETRALLSAALKTARETPLNIQWEPGRAASMPPETAPELDSWRFTNLAPTGRTLLDVLAVANEPLPFKLLREFPGIEPAHLASAIDELLAKGLLAKTDPDLLALSRAALREALYKRISHLRRQEIHRQLAAIIEGCPALQQAFPLREMARHAVIGEDIERARRYGLRVLDELVQDGANAQTAAFLHHLHDLLAPTASNEEILRLTRALGQVYQSLGQLDEGVFWRRRQLEIARALSDLPAQAEAHLELGELALAANDDQEAAAEAGASLAIELSPTEAQRMALIARGHRLLGAALAMEGSDLAAAGHHLREAVSALQHTGSTSDLCAALFELGNVAAQRGELRQALSLYQEAARAAETAQVHYFHALACNNFAYHSLLLGDLAAARQALTEGMKLAGTYEMSAALLHLSSTRGEIHLYLGEWNEAAAAFQSGLALAQELGNLERQAGNRAGLALVRQGQGLLEEAADLLEEALSLIAGRGYWHLHTRLQLWLAEVMLRRGRLDAAEAALQAARGANRLRERGLLLLQSQRLRARLLMARGDQPKAAALFTRALEQAATLDLPLEVARARAAWGMALLAHAPDEARPLLAEARVAFAAFDARAELYALEG